MITIYREEGMTKEGQELEYRGLSTDDKPTENVTNGSIFIEIDTGKIYMFDLENEEWMEI